MTAAAALLAHAVLLAVAWGALLLPGAEAAAFADRSALQTALFGCVGACPGPLYGSSDETYCFGYCTGANCWVAGTGASCNAGSWDVSRVLSMRRSECSSSILSLSPLSDDRLPLALLLLLLLGHCCCVFPRWFSSLFLISCCCVPLLYYIGSHLSLPLTLVFAPSSS